LEQQERLTLNQWKIISVAILGGTLGSLAFFLDSFALGAASASRHLTYAQSPLIRLSVGVGSVLGPGFWGWMADRIGRRKTFIATVLNVALASGMMALTPDQGGLLFLSVLFFFGGLGASGLFVALLPLVQEFVPASKRGWIGGMVIALISSGMFASVQGARLALLIGWRALFALGLLPAVVTLLIRAWVPESPRWLIRNGLLEEARRSLAWALRKDPNEIDLPAAFPKMPRTPWRELFNYPRSVAVTCLISLAQVGSVGIGLWAGVYTSILHICWPTVVYLTLGVSLAGLAGQFVMSYLSDAIGRRKSGMLCGFGAALSLVFAGLSYDAFFGTVSVFWLLVMVASFFSIGSAAIVRPYTAEVWPLGLRASGMGLAYGVGSLGGLLAPRGLELIIGAPSLSSPQSTPGSVLPAMLFLAAWYALAGLVFWLLAVETKGRSIEEIEAVLA
jgi:putative MFS transporter